MDESLSAYEAARADGRAALRDRLVRVAGRILERSGVDGLSMRPLAKAAGCSTMVFYTEFRSKDGLLDALAGSAARSLLDAVETVSDVDPVAHRRLVAHAYLDAAFAEPEHYRILFRRPRQGAGGATLRDLVARLRGRVEEALAADAPVDPSLSFGLWLTLHGAVVLALDGQVTSEEARGAVDAAVDGTVRW